MEALRVQHAVKATRGRDGEGGGAAHLRHGVGLMLHGHLGTTFLAVITLTASASIHPR